MIDVGNMSSCVFEKKSKRMVLHNVNVTFQLNLPMEQVSFQKIVIIVDRTIINSVRIS